MDGAAPRERRVAFRTTILQAGKTATGVVVPDEVVEALGAGKRPPVRVTIGGYTYRSTVAVMRGRFMLAGQRRGARGRGRRRRRRGRDRARARHASRASSTVPADFAAALDADAEARRFFDGLSYSNQRRFVDAIAGAKTAETRAAAHREVGRRAARRAARGRVRPAPAGRRA